MTASGPAPDGAFQADPGLTRLVRVAAEDFANLGFAAEGGVLDLGLDGGAVRGVRVEQPRGHLRLQSIGIEAAGLTGDAGSMQVRTSSRHPDAERDLEPAVLFDFDDPKGTLVDTGADHPAWLDVRFDRPLPVTRIRLRNVIGETAHKSRGVRVMTRGRWRRHVAYDDRIALHAWNEIVAAAKADAALQPGGQELLELVDVIVRANYERAHRLFLHVPDGGARRWFQDAVNEALLPARGLEWTVHGARRPFRLWTDAEQTSYVGDGARVVDALRSLTPNACFGFGSALAIVRDHALIPHDDDLDIIVGFEPDEASTIADGLQRVERHLSGLGYEVSGSFDAHRHVRLPGRKPVDVFVGLFEGDSISWYPAARGALTRAVVFPASSAPLLGVTCPIPAQPEVYLERMYGSGWRVPDPYFNHPWNVADYADIRGTPVPAGGATVAGPDPDQA